MQQSLVSWGTLSASFAEENEVTVDYTRSCYLHRLDKKN